jgi:hypothetical protein
MHMIKHGTSTLAGLVVLCFLSAVVVQSQKQPEAQWVEAEVTGFLTKGGTVNAIEGDVTVGGNGADFQVLRAKQQLVNGQEVKASGTGRAEILLNPGYYLRLSRNTQATFLDLSRENLKLKLVNGSAIIEVLEISDQGRTFGPEVPLELLAAIYPSITIVTPDAEFVIVTGGVYRFDVNTNGSTNLKVTKGLAFVAGNRLRSGTEATVRGGSTTLAKFDKKSGDEFDDWSRARAAMLIEANKLLRHTQWSRTLRNNQLTYFRIEDDQRSRLARERHIVSAIGGLVNFSEGGALIGRGGAEWEPLAVGDGLQYGDKVKTGREGRIEILLYPTCYLHLSTNAEILYDQRQAGGVAVRLVKGSAVVTSLAEEKDDAAVTLLGPGAEYEVGRKGVYRLNVLPPDRSEIIVYEGQLNSPGGKIKDGKKSVTEDQETAIVSIDKKALDSLDLWSRRRTASLAVSAEWVRQRVAKFKSERVYNNGMWYFDKWYRTYTFVPGIWDFSSPYGGDYSVKFRANRF